MVGVQKNAMESSRVRMRTRHTEKLSLRVNYKRPAHPTPPGVSASQAGERVAREPGLLAARKAKTLKAL